MSNRDMIARLTSYPEFAELRRHFDEQREEDVQRLARKSFALPAEHATLEWEQLKAFHAGVDAALALPQKLRKKPDADTA